MPRVRIKRCGVRSSRGVYQMSSRRRRFRSTCTVRYRNGTVLCMYRTRAVPCGTRAVPCACVALLRICVRYGTVRVSNHTVLVLVSVRYRYRTVPVRITATSIKHQESKSPRQTRNPEDRRPVPYRYATVRIKVPGPDNIIDFYGTLRYRTAVQ
jgi:hypothetical protein